MMLGAKTRAMVVSTLVTVILATALPAATAAGESRGAQGEIAPRSLPMMATSSAGMITALMVSAGFTRAEKLLLRAVPAPIRSRCVPRRTALPKGTVAALQCRPGAQVVRDMAYYLLDAGPAGRVFEQRRADAGVQRDGRCVLGRPAVTYWIGGMPTSELCYRNEDRRANLRFLEPATRCRQLTVGRRTLKVPTIYIAVLGRDRNIRALARWATDGGDADPSVLTKYVSQPGARWSPGCPR